MEFGYGGSGPSDFAYSLLCHWFGEHIAEQEHQDFKRAFIERMPAHGGEITLAQAVRWLNDRDLMREVEEGP